MCARRVGPGVCVCARAGCVPGDGVGRERRSQAQRTTQCVCVCVCVCVYIYVMVIHAGICLPNHISGIFLNSTNFRYSLLLDLMPDQCGPVFESEKMGNTTSSSIVCIFLLHIFVLPSFSKLF